MKKGVRCRRGCGAEGGVEQIRVGAEGGAVQKGVRRRRGCRRGYDAEGGAVQKVHAFLCLSG